GRTAGPHDGTRRTAAESLRLLTGRLWAARRANPTPSGPRTPTLAATHHGTLIRITSRHRAVPTNALRYFAGPRALRLSPPGKNPRSGGRRTLPGIRDKAPRQQAGRGRTARPVMAAGMTLSSSTRPWLIFRSL